jgi:hypothetical protein
MMEVVKRENEQAEMLLLALAFYPAEGLKARELPRELEGSEVLPLPGTSISPGLALGGGLANIGGEA